MRLPTAPHTWAVWQDTDSNVWIWQSARPRSVDHLTGDILTNVDPLADLTTLLTFRSEPDARAYADVLGSRARRTAAALENG